MEIRLLGPVELVTESHTLIPLRRRQERCLLAVLALERGRVVTVGRLAELLWEDSLPEQPGAALRSHLSRIRSALKAAGSEAALVNRGDGYLLELPPGCTDVERFRELVDRASADGDPAARSARLGAALELWRGPALADAAGGSARERLCAGLEEQRLVAIEERVEAELTLGRHREVVGELTELIGAHPLRERLRAQLMLALYRGGRRADALAVYRRTRAVLVAELGLEPGPALRELEQRILADDPKLTGAATAAAGSAAAVAADPAGRVTGAANAPAGPVPAQLPADAAAFTGRAEPLRTLDALLALHRDEPSPAVVVSAIAGQGGVGKTALAVHWAHRVRDRFPDGQLYVNLNGYAPTPPLRPFEALAWLLTALGVPAEQVPPEPEPAAALYRSRLAGRRMLIVLDNARSADQVRPLLPGGPGCFVIVTSRDRLSGLVAREGARRVTLGVLTPDEAQVLLARLLGPDRILAEPAAADDLAGVCARLPLALRIAAAHLLDEPHRSIAEEVAMLQAGNRLARLTVDGDEETAVRAVFDLSYRTLDPAVRQLFRRLGLLPGVDVTLPAATALAGGTAAETRRLLDRLLAAHLVDQPVPGRYDFHDLLRAFAADAALREDSAADRSAALDRLHDYYLCTTAETNRLLHPNRLHLPVAAGPGADPVVRDRASALAWLEAERRNLVAAVTLAAEHGRHPAAWRLGDAVRSFFGLGPYLRDGQTVAQAALAAAEADGAALGRASAHATFGLIRWRETRYDTALDHLARAAADAAEAGWGAGEANSLGNAGAIETQLGRVAEAVEHLGRAVVLFRELGNDRAEAIYQIALGCAYVELGQPMVAQRHLDRALVVHQATGGRDGEALARTNLGAVHYELGAYDRAVDELGRAIVLHAELGNPVSVAYSRCLLGSVHVDAGRLDDAAAHATAATTMAVELGNRRLEAEALTSRASIDLRVGRWTDAAERSERALRLARETGDRAPEVRAALVLATAHRGLGNLAQARAVAGEALDVARAVRARLREGRALTVLAEVDLAADDPRAAVARGELALAIHHETAHRPGQAGTHLVLGHAHNRSGDPLAALRHWQQALDRYDEMGVPEADEVRALLFSGSAAAAPDRPGRS